MKKILLLALTTLIMVGCDTEPYYGTVYHGINGIYIKWMIHYI